MEATGPEGNRRIRKSRVILVISNMRGSWCPRKMAGYRKHSDTPQVPDEQTRLRRSHF